LSNFFHLLSSLSSATPRAQKKNSTMFGSECNLKMHVYTVKVSLLLRIESEKPPIFDVFRRIRNRPIAIPKAAGSPGLGGGTSGERRRRCEANAEGARIEAPKGWVGWGLVRVSPPQPTRRYGEIVSQRIPGHLQTVLVCSSHSIFVTNQTIHCRYFDTTRKGIHSSFLRGDSNRRSGQRCTGKKAGVDIARVDSVARRSKGG